MAHFLGVARAFLHVYVNTHARKKYITAHTHFAFERSIAIENVAICLKKLLQAKKELCTCSEVQEERSERNTLLIKQLAAKKQVGGARLQTLLCG